jgi:hypothetical protein
MERRLYYAVSSVPWGALLCCLFIPVESIIMLSRGMRRQQYFAISPLCSILMLSVQLPGEHYCAVQGDEDEAEAAIFC